MKIITLFIFYLHFYLSRVCGRTFRPHVLYRESWGNLVKNGIMWYIFKTEIPTSKSLLIENKKTCADCKYFISNKKECKKIGELDLITGKIRNEKASVVRYDEKKCGKKGNFYEKNYFKFITIPYYFILEHSIFILSTIYGFIPLIVFLYFT